MEWSLESFLESILESFLESILNSILPIYNNTKQTQKMSNELKIVGGRLSEVIHTLERKAQVQFIVKIIL
jgi:hypothetical protein